MNDFVPDDSMQCDECKVVSLKKNFKAYYVVYKGEEIPETTVLICSKKCLKKFQNEMRLC